MTLSNLNEIAFKLDEHLGQLKKLIERLDVTPLEVLQALIDTTALQGMFLQHLIDNTRAEISMRQGWY